MSSSRGPEALRVRGGGGAGRGPAREEGRRAGIDVLRWPAIGRFLRWRWGRLVLQGLMAALAGLAIYDGFTGDALAARNLATVSIWVHFRGLAILALLLAGNLFCMACPFTIPRSLARGLGMGRLKWPRWLRNKWVSISSLFGLFFLYEWLDLWRSPWLTAWLVVGYFVGAFALEALFEGSAFCKYVCPLGAFNFVYSTVSPLRIQAVDSDVCRTCAGKECLNGSSQVAGCGTRLFVPAMSSSLDCTLCLDCVRACPYENVALVAERPGRQIEAGGWRERGDLGFLAISLAFMGLANAFGMTPPVYRWLEVVGRALGTAGSGWPLLVVMGGLELGLPALAAWGAAWGTRVVVGKGAGAEAWSGQAGRGQPGAEAWSGQAGRGQPGAEASIGRLVGRFGPSFVPLGMSIWLVHYMFHFLTGALAIVPVMHFFLIDHGLAGGRPDFGLAAIVRPGALRALEVWGVAAGFLGSFALAFATGVRVYGTRARGLRAALPWIVVLGGLAAAAIRVFGYPMEMRGIGGG